MDFDSLKNQVSNLSLYDIKAGFRKAQNAVMNYTELEAKVREATNNEPWGASTSMMQEIANATFNYASLNEIMPMIYKRFTEKAAEEWRQIYKGLQLLEFLIKNGSERVIDDARSHMSLLKMLRQFHFIDMNGKDQGINVRNRAKELADLLGDVERIRSERKKSRTTRNKYGGVEGGAGLGGGSAPKYGGFGSETGGAAAGTYGGFSGGVYGDGGGFGGANEDDYEATQSRRDKFEEYDEYDEGGAAASAAPARRKPQAATSTATSTKRATAVAKPEPPKPKAPEVDLFDFGNDEIPIAPISNGKQTASAPATEQFGAFESAADEDEFDDFQSAATTTGAPSFTPLPTSSTSVASPAPPAAPTSYNNNLYSNISAPPSSTASPAVNYSAFTAPAAPQYQQPTRPTGAPSYTQPPTSTPYQAASPNYFGSIPAAGAAPQQAPNRSAPASGVASSARPTAKSGGADPFASLAIGGLGAKKTTGAQGKGLTMADMAKQKASAGIWGAAGSMSPTGQRPSGGSGGDLLG